LFVTIWEWEENVEETIGESVSKISLTTNMWKYSHQLVEYMVITRHFINVGWNLQKIVLIFVKMCKPRHGIDVAEAIYKYLKT